MPDKHMLNLKTRKAKQTKPRSTTPAPKPSKKAAKVVSPKVKTPKIRVEKHVEGGIDPDILTVPGDLPELYGAPRVVFMPVDPYLANVYWEIDAGEMDRIGKRLKRKFNRLQPALRFYEHTSNGNGTNANYCFDIDIDVRAGNWYIHLPGTGKSYFADLGIKVEGGIFFPIVRSNTAEMPRGWTQPEETEECVFVSRSEARHTGITRLAFMLDMPLKAEVTSLQTVSSEGPEAGDLTAVNEKVFLPGISSLPLPSE